MRRHTYFTSAAQHPRKRDNKHRVLPDGPAVAGHPPLSSSHPALAEVE